MGLLLKVFKAFKAHHTPQLAASLSYYAIFSIAPLILLLMSLLGIFLNSSEIQSSIFSFLQSNVGSESAEIIDSMIKGLSDRSGSFLGNILGGIVLIVAATGVLNQLQYAFNVIWNVKLKPSSGLKVTLKKRLLSFVLVLVVGGLIFASFILSTGLSIAIRFLSDSLPFLRYAFPLLEVGISLGLMSLLFMVLFQYFPDVKLKLSDVWRAGLLTGLLFLVGKIGISWYLTTGGGLSSYGVAGSFIAILLWIYYSSLILLFGAEFNHIWMKEKGFKIIPEKVAIKNNKRVILSLAPRSKILQKLWAIKTVLKKEFQLIKWILIIKKKIKRQWQKFIN